LGTEVEGLLREAGLLSAATEARWLVEEASGLPAGEWVGQPATARGAGRLSQMVERRLAGEPLQYVIGHWPFRGLDLLLDHRVLIPRPETEVVAEVALAAVRAGTRRGPSDPWGASPPTLAVADLGTGSGALALALAAELPEAEVWGTDADPGALAVASANLAGLGLAATRVRLAAGVWYEALPDELRGRLRLIVSNPPYVAEAEFAALSPEIRDHEPRGALVPGPAGTEALEALVDGGLPWLEPGAALVLELAPHQAAGLADRARASGYENVAMHPDLAGRLRVLVACRPVSQ
jgi:release factor glutamine methyltransferase